MTNPKPSVSIGMPVFNGANYITEALDSLLAQTYTDFEIIISDNASTDGTEEICRAYARKDRRIRYLRNKTNLGAVKNYNRVFALSSGEYFKWAAHDDMCAPEYLERCVDVLSQHPSVTICHPKTVIVDESGERMGNWEDDLDFRSTKAHERFHDYLFRRARLWNAIFGVIRASELRKTPLFGNYLGCDKVLLGELVLLGEVHQLPDRLFLRRRHPQQWWRVRPGRKEKTIWLDPANEGNIQLPTCWKHFVEYLSAIRRAQLDWKEQSWCHLYMMKWLCKELAGPLVRRLRKRTTSQSIWSEGNESETPAMVATGTNGIRKDVNNEGWNSNTRISMASCRED
ncbi:MAG: glycosyltransferase family 2 protein [Phycisphaerales bacterium]|nr:MAG: glycosyltransferase family 2 protein [Phycisphaerales bacterium]